MSQLIDIAAAKEFMKETLDRVNREELIAIASGLEVKSAFFQHHLQPGKTDQLSPQEMEDLLRCVFATRRHFSRITGAQSHEKLRAAVNNLLHGPGSTDARFRRFVEEVSGTDEGTAAELAGELLHFTYPDRYWLWSRWMWDPRKRTGALPLVTTEGFDLQGSHTGEVYMKVGKGVAFVHSVAEAAGFRFISGSLFGTDVFLSCVYVIYAYTVLRMRMTQEFNKVMPGLPEFTRRLLGVYRLPQVA
jgi:hypothetical protein